MGSSNLGYKYSYNFSMVDEQEIQSRHKEKENLIEGLKALLFQITTDFTVVKARPEEGDVRIDSETFDALTYKYEDAKEDMSRPEEGDVHIDSETFDALTYKYEDAKEDMSVLFFTTEYRLREYWMNCKEIHLFVEAIVAFARNMSSKPENSSLNIIPVVVHLQVCTVQQEGEPFDEAMDRAITAQKLVPLYLWPQPTVLEPKPRNGSLLIFLRRLDRIRVVEIDQGLALMQDCHICKRKPNVGAQITVLPCNHAFHSHCIVRCLEEVKLCPICCCCPQFPPFEHCRAAERG